MLVFYSEYILSDTDICGSFSLGVSDILIADISIILQYENTCFDY